MRTRIKDLRKALNMTQSEFGVSLGFAPTSAASWEKAGAQEPSALAKQMMQRVHNVNIHWLETGEGEMFSCKADDAQAIAARVAREYGADPLLRAFMTTYFQLSESKRALLLEIVESFTAALADALSSGRPAPDFSEFVHGHGDVIAAARSASPIPAEDSLSS